MSGIRTMKEFGLTGIPVQHVENASATGSAAFREACLAVASGRHDVVMVLGFDKMTAMIQSSSQTTHPAWLEDAILPAAFFALWATRRMHERGTKPEHLAAIAAKNWNNGALNPMSQRQAEKPVTAEKVLGSRMVAWPLTTMMSCPSGDFAPGGRVPVSTDGGLIARGHPGGPTGLAQIWETTLQLRGEAGRRQVENARVGLCHMMGGGSVCVIHLLVRE